jgi:hypothetical protein
VIKGFLNLPWFVWAGLALIVAIIYYFVWPNKAIDSSTGFRFLIIRYSHTLTWLLIAVNFLLRGLSPSYNGIANLIAAMGGVIYLLFIVMTFVVK